MAQVLPSLEPECEKFALSPTADLDEIREFLRCESLERMQLCMRLQKQQELLEQLSEGFLIPTPLKDVGALDRNEDPRSLWMGGGQKQLHAEVDALKRSLETLTQDVKDLQESFDAAGCRMEGGPNRLVLCSEGKVQDDYPEDREGELDRSYKVAENAENGSAAESGDFAEGVYEAAVDLQWLDERFEELQRQCVAEMSHLEDRLMEDFGNLKGFVDAAIVAMVSRMSTLEILVKGEGGLLEKMEELKEVPQDSVSPQRLQSCEDQLSEVNERLKGLEKRVTGLSERPSSVAFSPAPGCRSIGPAGSRGDTESSVIDKHPEALSPQRVLSHGPVLLNPPSVLNPPGSLKVPPVASWGSPVQPIFRLQGASSSQLVTVLATPRTSSPTREVRSAPLASTPPSAVMQGGRSVTPLRTMATPVVRAPAPSVVRF